MLEKQINDFIDYCEVFQLKIKSSKYAMISISSLRSGN